MGEGRAAIGRDDRIDGARLIIVTGVQCQSRIAGHALLAGSKRRDASCPRSRNIECRVFVVAGCERSFDHCAPLSAVTFGAIPGWPLFWKSRPFLRH
jgi:hypothetical protein